MKKELMTPNLRRLIAERNALRAAYSSEFTDAERSLRVRMLLEYAPDSPEARRVMEILAIAVAERKRVIEARAGGEISS